MLVTVAFHLAKILARVSPRHTRGFGMKRDCKITLGDFHFDSCADPLASERWTFANYFLKEVLLSLR